MEMSDEEFRDLLRLAGGADSVELKLTIPHEDQRATIGALRLDPLDAQIRQVFFFDTPDLALNRHGVVARARRVQGRRNDSVVKLRPVDPEGLSDRLRASPNLVVEVDAMPGGHVCSASLKGTLGSSTVADVVGGNANLRKAFSKEQRAFFSENAPDGVDIDSLSILGPIFVLKQNTKPKGYGGKLVAELWLYPDGTRLLELSTKCVPAEMFDVAAHTRAFLQDRGVDLSGEQQTKTKTALEYFAGRLHGGAPSA
ncbi:MAG: adenylate cyclase [Actinomycetota bacterium]